MLKCSSKELSCVSPIKPYTLDPKDHRRRVETLRVQCAETCDLVTVGPECIALLRYMTLNPYAPVVTPTLSPKP